MFTNTKENVSEEQEINNEETREVDAAQSQELIPGFATFDEYMKAGFSTIKEGIKVSNGLPSEDNFKYYTCFPSFNNARSYQIKRILDLIQGIVESTGASSDVRRRDVEENLDLLVEVNDTFLDRANACMNEESGIKTNAEVELVVSQAKKSSNVNGSWNSVVNRQSFITPNSGSPQCVRLLGAKNVQRPQLTFKDKIDNSSKPWQPRIFEKPNALKPLSVHVEEGEELDEFCHPYKFELDMFQVPEKQMEKLPPIKYKPLEETPMIVIEKESDIDILLNDLLKYDEISIDLEHHAYRSFQGITCLMQISTRDTDYIIDTLTLRSELYKLNEVFTKPTVLKVFHGAVSDIQWLQKDLSLYVVNMFDTYQAAKQLELPYLSLAYLMKTYCGLEPNKHFQLADWRIRPLPQELLKYAQEDTHYLLYIKDILRNALIDAANGQKNILKAVYDRSTEVCRIRYQKPIWTEESYMRMYRKSLKMFNNRQLFALEELHKWRDITAREEDDSVNYVLPNHMLLNIAETLPREMQGVLACCNPIPPLVRQNLLRLHKMILKARDQPLIKPILEEDIRQRMTQRSHVTHSESWIYSPHDTPQGTEPRADLTCLLSSNFSIETSCLQKRIEHGITVFDEASSDDEDVEMSEQTFSAKKKLSFVSPFERYKRVMPIIAEHEAKERERQANKEKIEKEETLTETEKNTSISRVHQHFKHIAENTNVNDKNLPLSRMHNKKRKRNSNIDDQRNVNGNSMHDVSAQSGVIKCKIVKEDINNQEEKNTCDAFVNQTDSKRKNNETDEVVQPFRFSKKGRKKEAVKDLKAQGMLPADNFNYETVDFSSFQGGSKLSKNDNSETIFKQNQGKNTQKKGKRKRKKHI